MRDSTIFDEAIAKFFAPIARRLGFPIVKVEDGIYEVLSPHFIMRVRLHTGHARGMNVILREASHREFNENDPFVQYGIGCFMEYCGEKLDETFISVDSDEAFIKQARLLAQASERFAVPYLIGEGKDFQAIKEIYTKKAEEAAKKVPKYKFPSFVQKRWHLPKP